MSEWFYGSPDRKLGPVPQMTLVAMARNRTLTRDTLVWTETMPEWLPAARLPFVFAPNTASNDAGMNLLLPIGPQSGVAIAAGYLGLVSLIPGLALITGPLGIIFGLWGLSDLKKHPEKRGTGRSITGIALGALGLVLTVAIFVLGK